MIALLLTAAAAAPDCSKMFGVAADECALAKSMEIDPPPNCVKRETQFDLNVCSGRDFLRADIELNRTWVAVTKRLSGQQKVFATLVAGQRAWLTYRDKQCDVWAQLYEGGTIAPLEVSACETDITKFRVKELGELLKDQ